MPRLVLFILLCAIPVLAQPESGELHLKVADQNGVGVSSKVELRSASNGFAAAASTDESGRLTVEHVPFGMYSLRVDSGGFAPVLQRVEVHSALPIEVAVHLSVQAPSTTVNVNDASGLLDPEEPSSVQRISEAEVENRSAGLPGRSVQDLVNQQPGWLYESNAVLHPRGSEYQAQFVVDGIPLTENRSPGIGPGFDAGDVASMSVYTSGYPAEYGRKLGGVIEINTARDARVGVHGEVSISGGSFATRDGYARLQDHWGGNTLTLSGNAGATDWFLNPPVLQDFTNRGTDGALTLQYERDLDARDRVTVSLRHDQSRFLVPNELLQELAAQRQDRGNNETLGTISFQHIFTANLLTDLRVMARSVDANLTSNTFSTPIVASQNRSFNEQYAKASVAYHRGANEWKAGVEADFATIDERFSYSITDPTDFDPSTPSNFSFFASSPDREQSAFVQDAVRFGNWTASLGLRWDHYRLLLDRNAVSPRIGLARALPSLGLVLHASYDRIFQTPAMENLLLSSSPQIAASDSRVVRLPVKPSLGNYFEVGASKEIRKTLRADMNYFHRGVSNFADDDLLLNTSIGFPISFQRASIYGAEAKIEAPVWKRFSSWASYSYMVGHAYLPVTGGLFLGTDAGDALSAIRGRFAITQDQRNTFRTRLSYDISSRLWTAFSTSYGSGLPVEFEGSPSDALAQYGPQIVDRVDLARGRVRPNFSLDLSASAEVWKHEKKTLRLQADIENLTNQVNLINFTGLFSGNTLEPPRSYYGRLVMSF